MTAIIGTVLFLFFGGILIGLNLLPTTQQIPLPPEIATSLTLIFGYTFAWIGIFPALGQLLLAATFSIGLELAILIWRMVRWIIGVVRGSRA